MMDKRTKQYKEGLKRAEALNKGNIPEIKDNASTGLGDTLEKVFEATGVTKFVAWAFGKDCGCSERRDKLNSLFPYKRKIECLLEEEYNWIKEYNKRHNPKNFTKEDVWKIQHQIYPRIFHRVVSVCRNCDSGVKKMNLMIQDLNTLVDLYDEELKKQ